MLRDVYVRGKYRDVILPMTVIRRLDAVLEPAKDAVLRMKEQLDDAGVTNQDAALRQASGEAFYNTSQFRLRDLTSRGRQQQLRADFEAYLDGFSPNVQEVLEKFKFRNQIPTLVEADALGFLLEKFLDRSINLSPRPVLNGDGSVRLEGLDNHAMGTVFEEKLLCDLSRVGQTHGQVSLYGGTKDGLSLDDVKNYPILLPPLDQQTTIVEYLDRALTDTDAAIARVRRQIELVEEYPTRVITDVVTGKLDVREAAAQLPDEDPMEEDGPLVNGFDEGGQDAEEEPAIAEEVTA